MNEKQKKFLELAKYSEQLTDKRNEVLKELEAVMLELGVNTYLQDEETLAVYKVIEPTGIFVGFKKIDYKRTAFEGERQGSLSKKEAEEKGFYLKK